ncbi:hypothetical protein C7S16_2447 [Burkholderia thailandensis]|uniref:Uncharacterized protein n=1 Tax=Burkholderia thailandensis TaxID=57975 RepID=A0AAW9CYI9_BURTH|nr:hypothetical protein [Burkholderia thailandensis]MDW9254173.1 hypothetical protein [Burkholderia thailandensis]
MRAGNGIKRHGEDGGEKSEAPIVPGAAQDADTAQWPGARILWRAVPRARTGPGPRMLRGRTAFT